MMVLINLAEERATSLAQTFGCVLGTFPFTYLGLPLGLTKPKVVDFLPLVNRCERRLLCTSTFLSQTGHLEVTNSIFTTLPMFYMCTFQLHKTTIKQIDKFRKHRLWREQTSMQSNLQMLHGNGLFAKKKRGWFGCAKSQNSEWCSFTQAPP